MKARELIALLEEAQAEHEEDLEVVCFRPQRYCTENITVSGVILGSDAQEEMAHHNGTDIAETFDDPDLTVYIGLGGVSWDARYTPRHVTQALEMR